MSNQNSYYNGFRIKKVNRELDSEGKEKKVLLYLDKNDPNTIDMVNSKNQIVLYYEEKIRKN